MVSWSSSRLDVLPGFMRRTAILSHRDPAYLSQCPDLAVLVSRYKGTLRPNGEENSQETQVNSPASDAELDLSTLGSWIKNPAAAENPPALADADVDDFFDNLGPLISAAQAEEIRPSQGPSQELEEFIAADAVLYLSDFWSAFVNPSLAEAIEQAGYTFHALDLRRQGRSAEEAGLDTRNDVRDLHIYFEEITAALELLRAGGAENIAVLAQGGSCLPACIYAREYPEAFSGLILSSPWFDYEDSWAQEGPWPFVARLLGSQFPRLPIAHTPAGLAQPTYTIPVPENARSLAPTKPEPVYAGFYSAVRQAQADIAGGLRLELPVLLACARLSSTNWFANSEQRHVTDCVLEVEDMLARAEKLSSKVDLLRVENGIHDLAASKPLARAAYFAGLQNWLRQLKVESLQKENK